MKEPVAPSFALPPAARGDDESPCAPSRHLWVGNVAMETPESVVRDMFGKFGELEGITVYPQRQYAFVNFRKQEDAERAKEGLVGAHIAGQPIRLEFAKGARPNRHLSVTGIAPTVTKEMLEAEFQKFGSIEEFKLMKDKSSAMVDFLKTDDAISAVEALNGKRYCDEVLRVDYRTLAPKRGPVSGSSAPSSAPRSGGGKDDPPSEVLWIGLPTSAKFDEDTLLRLFLPYGEVERVKLFASRSYCFVEFRSVREATLAKNALSGKLINGHRLHIEFSTSEVGPVDPKDAAAAAGSEPEAKKSRASPADQQSRPRLGSPFLAAAQAPLPLWQGLIAKGGTVVCQVRGFPATGKVDTFIPEVVNCTSRTDLDRLADHIYPAMDFPVVFFQPVREVDVTPYHDFMRYLREKHRAGVAKLSDSTNIFLVPPSPFAEKVLKVTRNDCIFGAVLNFRTQTQDHFQTSQPPPPLNLPPEVVASLSWPMSTAPTTMPNPPSVSVSSAGPPPGFAWPGPAVEPALQQQQQQNPQLPIEQLAQLTALLKQQSSSQQQQQAAQAPAWVPNAAVAQFQQGDPDQFQRTLALAAQMLKGMQDKK